MGSSASKEIISELLSYDQNQYDRVDKLTRFIKESKDVEMNEFYTINFNIDPIRLDNPQVQRRASSTKNVGDDDESSPNPKRTLYFVEHDGKVEVEHSLLTLLLREILDENPLSCDEVQEKYVFLLKYVLSNECPHCKTLNPFAKTEKQSSERYEDRIVVHEDALSYIVYNFPQRIDILKLILDFIKSKPELVKGLKQYVIGIEKHPYYSTLSREESILEFYARKGLVKEFQFLLRDYAEIFNLEHCSYGHSLLMTIADVECPQDEEKQSYIADKHLRTVIKKPKTAAENESDDSSEIAVQLFQAVISYCEVTDHMLSQTDFGHSKLTPFFYAIERGATKVVTEFLVSKLASVDDCATNWQYKSHLSAKLGGIVERKVTTKHFEATAQKRKDDYDPTKEEKLMNPIQFAAEQLRHEVLLALLAQPGANDIKNNFFEFVDVDYRAAEHAYKGNALSTAVWSTEGNPYGHRKVKNRSPEDGKKTIRVLWMNGCRKVVRQGAMSTLSKDLVDLSPEQIKRWKLEE